MRATTLDQHRTELLNIERELARLTDAIASGGEMSALLTALKARQARQEELRRAIAEAERQQDVRFDRRAIELKVRERLTNWRALLTGHVGDGRELFRQVLRGPIRLTPQKEATPYYQFEGEVELGRLFIGIAGLAPLVASPTGRPPVVRGQFRRAAYLYFTKAVSTITRGLRACRGLTRHRCTLVKLSVNARSADETSELRPISV